MRIFAFLICFFPILVSAQLTAPDLELLAEHSEDAHNHNHSEDEFNDKEVMETKKRGALARYNPVTLLAKGAMSAYQHAFSPQLGQRCNYEMSCSNFSKHAIGEFGIFKGVYVSADRLLRCNRISYTKIHPTKINLKTRKVLDFPSHYRVKPK